MAKRPSQQEVLRSLMMPSPAANSDPALVNRPEVVIPVVLELDIDQLRPYDRNPRHIVNAKREELKESIRALGLLSPLTVTRRPTDPENSFMIQAGGNTRLEILRELWNETRDPRFKKIMCLIVPWTSEPDVFARHIAENEESTRCELLPIDKANALEELKTLIEAETGTELSQGAFIKKLEALGFITVSRRQYSRLVFVRKLNAWLPNSLRTGDGLTYSLISQIQALVNLYQDIWNDRGHLEDRYESVWGNALSKFDGEGDLNIDDVERELSQQLADEMNIGLHEIALLADEARSRLRRPPRHEPITAPAGALAPLPQPDSYRRPVWDKSAQPQRDDIDRSAQASFASNPAPAGEVFGNEKIYRPDVNAGADQERMLIDSSSDLDGSAESSDSHTQQGMVPLVDADITAAPNRLLLDHLRPKNGSTAIEANTRPFDHFRGQLRTFIDTAYKDAIAALDAEQIRSAELMSWVAELAMSADSKMRPMAAGYAAAILAKVACLYVGLTDCVVEDSRSPCGFWMELPSVADRIRSVSEFLPKAAIRSAADLPIDLEWPSHSGRLAAANQQCNWWWYLYGLCGGSRIPVHLPGMAIGEQALILTKLGSLQLHQACYDFSPAGELAYWQNYDNPIMRADEEFARLIDDNLDRLHGLPPEQFSLASVDLRFAAAIGAPAWTSMPLWIATLSSDEFAIHQTLTVLVRAQQIL